MRRIKLISILPLFALYFIAHFVQACSNNSAHTTAVYSGNDTTLTQELIVDNSRENQTEPKNAGDFQLLFAGLIALYEVVVRLIKTKSNYSIIDIVHALINTLLPNRLH